MTINSISVIGLTIAAVLSLAACGQATESAAPSPTAPDPTAEVTAAAPDTDAAQTHNDADVMFAQMMIIHHEGAIEMADLAVETAESEDVRVLSQAISAAQGPEIETMASWLEAWGEDERPMDGMGHMDHGGMDMDGMSQDEAMGELEGLSGADFDRRYLGLMIAHHEGAVEMSAEQLSSGENPQARDLAQRIIDDQRAEISLMEEMLGEL